MMTTFGLKSAKALTCILVLAIFQFSCAPTSSPDSAAAKKPNEPPASNALNNRTPTPEVFDFEKECGLAQGKFDDKNAVLVDGNYTSFPIVVQGTSMGTDFAVVTQAKVSVSAKGTGSTVIANIQVLDTASEGGGLASIFAPGIVKSQAQDAAKKASGTTTSTSLALKDWLKLTNGSNAEYKDILCAATGTQSMHIVNGTTDATISFTPILISAVSPFAPIDRMRKEIGASGKSFSVTALVQGKGDGIKPGTIQGRVTLHEIASSFTQMDSTVTSDIAYEFIFEFPGGAFQVGLPKRQAFYIDTTKKQIRAIVTEYDRIIDITKKPVPTAYLVRDR